ncbi:MAG: nucleotide exchange factor GrpE [Alphaproteobacteria bacterium]|nr:nucleotide exchange factor GrpE [Alphaproteobacteria bacterium]
MVSDANATGGPAQDPAPDAPDTSLDIPAKPEAQPANDAARVLADVERRLEQFQAEKLELQDKFLRAAAEVQNIRRRAQQDVEKERKFGIERFARDILTVADNLGRALQALPADRETMDAGVRNVVAGVEATARELQAALERHGVTRIAALDQPFNAELHQAMLELEDPSKPAGTVVQELIPGYLIAGRLLRAAMVAVSKGGPPRAAAPPSEPPAEGTA